MGTILLEKLVHSYLPFKSQGAQYSRFVNDTLLILKSLLTPLSHQDKHKSTPRLKTIDVLAHSIPLNPNNALESDVGVALLSRRGVYYLNDICSNSIKTHLIAQNLIAVCSNNLINLLNNLILI